MQGWEYCSAELRSPGNVFYSRGWRLRAIDERELPKWRKTEVYVSVVAFCNYMDKYRWELISIDFFSTGAYALLLFKRPRSNEISMSGIPIPQKMNET